MPLGVRHGWDCPYGVCMCRGVRNGHLMLCVGLQAVHYMSVVKFFGDCPA